MFECSFESSLVSNLFLRKDFIVQIFESHKKNLPIEQNLGNPKAHFIESDLFLKFGIVFVNIIKNVL